MRIEIKNEEDDLLWKYDNKSGNPLWCMMYGPESSKNGRHKMILRKCDRSKTSIS